MKTLRTSAAAAVLLAATLPIMTAGSASASGDEGRVQRTGSCSGSADWKIKAKPDDGGLEVEAEIDSNRTGQQWSWVLRRNGSVVDRGTSTTRGPSGSFSVERRTGNASGSDTFRFRATNNGQVCSARVTI